MLRTPAVEGQFYPDDAEELKQMLAGFFSGLKSGQQARAVIAPHAGYIYSGKIAAKAIAALKQAKTFVILSPNHTGYGSAISVFPGGQWQTALGKIKVNEKLAQALKEKFGRAELDELAHIQEHSIEVLLPFLQHQFKGFEILPITLATHDFEALKALAQALFELQKTHDLAVIASSDFTHFESQKTAKEKDAMAIKLVESLKTRAFYDLVREKRLSICGFAPIIVLLHYCHLLGLKGELLEYGSSATASGDSSNVVGYAALKFD